MLAEIFVRVTSPNPSGRIKNFVHCVPGHTPGRIIRNGTVGRIRKSGQILGNFEEARSNPDKLTGPVSGQKVLFQDQGSSTIARGPPVPRLPMMARGLGHHLANKL